MTYSNNQVERAGEDLKKLANYKNHKLHEDTLKILTFWRDSHVVALDNAEKTVKTVMDSSYKNVFIARRIKRADSIIRKLSRFSRMSLKNMQDIGGIRVVLKNLKDVNRVFSKLKKHSDFCEEGGHTRFKNYLENPKQDGYRGIHVIGKFKNSENILRSVEVQLRTQLQHSWATSIEIVDIFSNNNLKFTSGVDEWSRFFKLASNQFNYIESLESFVKNRQKDLVQEYLSKALKNQNIANECIEIAELFNQVLSNKITIEYSFRSFADSIKFIHDELSKKSVQHGFYLLRLNLRTKSVQHEFFEKKEHSKASEQYTLYESTLQANPDWIVALVSSDAVDGIKQAYPNYFADSEVFISYVKLIENVAKVVYKQRVVASRMKSFLDEKKSLPASL
ncbi:MULTISPECIES: RelA/SpoT domain-containing protein [Acinetobacter]|jgi:ppGpp synthetase/RelA/SpoT-type nucleotidyltranferase|uniref:RelA/SpoT domain-containing protein n=1 Tax=Acinetobacter chengduensis TaxID=2420890 RepID=A0ABX9TUW9_9GAMM|nr:MULTISPECIES: RelA/SpoT domain-containing protein [Acinetobacter]MBI1450909.1 RelA/SpoT domain-containing protein [Acinetobacter sp. FL51]RKG41226.1 hypothetical protein D7V31_11180 [Acinetobacter sp. WCHAc060007]RLL21118.1 hypothetical protein D9K81_10325 [Acinetobacter chengduensis]